MEQNNSLATELQTGEAEVGTEEQLEALQERLEVEANS